jgi:thioredoxin-like negative regulator of GroEL
MRAALDAPIRTTAAVIDQILAAGYPSLVVFEKPACEPCLSLRPVLDEVAREFEGRVLVLRVTDAAEGWLAARYHLAYVPTHLFWRNAGEHARTRGNPGGHALRAHLDYLLTGEKRPEPAEGPRHTLQARFGRDARRIVRPRALLFAGETRAH